MNTVFFLDGLIQIKRRKILCLYIIISSKFFQLTKSPMILFKSSAFTRFFAWYHDDGSLRYYLLQCLVVDRNTKRCPYGILATVAFADGILFFVLQVEIKL